MKIAIFIRSYAKDADWLVYCLRSIRKFATGFAYTLVTTPIRDRMAFLPLQERFGFRLHEYELTSGKGMLHSEVSLCHADELCPDADFILHVDSDCCFKLDVSPQDYFKNGKPILIGESYKKLSQSNAACTVWQGAVFKSLGFYPEFETMRRFPIVYARGTYPAFRTAVERHTGRSFNDFVLSCKNTYPQDFAEFPALGAFALHDHPERYFFVDVDKPEHNGNADSGWPIAFVKLRQEYSGQGVTGKIKEEWDANCA